tara:strand:- start:10780 stop:11823 length:1044 start_codon:yes stop_codon:yes gene_type:complete
VKQEEIIKGFEQLGVLMTSLGENKDWENFSVGVTESEYLSLQTLINRQVSYNGWFTKENVRGSLLKLGSNLIYSDLLNWASSYTFSNEPRTIAVIMAGNIPLVGFHDFLSVLVSGNKIVAKLSSDDKTLLPALGQHLIEFIPGLKERIVFTSGRIGEIDAVIATGSDNSMQYFEQYFGKYPNIFRKNRTSIAVLKGDETEDDIKSLGSDIFDYFGLGCRNVSYLLLPEGFELSRFFEGVISYGEVIHNNKYGNNYDYNKAVYLMNKLEILDNNFCLLRESNELFSPLSMIHYQFYKDQSDIDNYIKEHESKIQVVVGRDYLDYGQAQCPGFNDYADGVDVMQWLNKL